MSETTSDYFLNFKDRILINSQNSDLKEVYAWCEQHLGVKYRDWFMMLDSNGRGVICGARLYIKTPKLATLFRLRWMEVIVID